MEYNIYWLNPGEKSARRLLDHWHISWLLLGVLNNDAFYYVARIFTFIGGHFHGLI